jgi:hypothetical protein
LLVEELLKLVPSEWSHSGHQLWSLVDAAVGLGAGINQDEAISTSITKAALRSDPVALCRVITAKQPNHRDEYWQYGVRNSLIAATDEALHEGEAFATDDKLALWCLAVGFCRWSRKGDVALLAGLRETFAATARDEKERSALLDGIARLTPAEAVRRADSEDEQPDDTANHRVEPLEEAVQRIRSGGACGLPECTRLVREILRTRAEEASELIPLILGSAAGKREYPTTWRSDYRGTVQSALELGKLVGEQRLWPLLQAACSEAANGSHWLQSVTDNMHVVLVSRAAAKGVDAVRVAIDRHLSMHRKWIRGARLELPITEVTIGPEVAAADWSEAGAQILLFLLNSRSGEVVSSALHAVHALASLRPNVIAVLLAGIKNDLWKSRWILNAAEAWAALLPDAIYVLRPEIEEWLSSDSLEHRLQAWIVLSRAAIESDGEKPRLQWSASNPEPTLIARRARDILEAPVEMRGLMRLSHRHRAASEHIRMLEATFGDLPTVRHRAAECSTSYLPHRSHSTNGP